MKYIVFFYSGLIGASLSAALGCFFYENENALVAAICSFIVFSVLFFYSVISGRSTTSEFEILNDYIIIEHIEVKAASTFHLTTQDQSKLVYKDALVKFTPKESRVKPGDTVIYNKAMAYPYLLDGKPHFIITEEYIVAIK